MTEHTPNATILHVDQEHTGIRVTVLLILVVTGIAAFFGLDALLALLWPELNTTLILSCLGAIVVGVAVTAVGERILKRVWPSGRKLIIEPHRITLRMPERDDRAIVRDKRLNEMWWHLPLGEYPRGGRERRQPGSWFCLAGQLQQDETRIVAYCYAPPKRKKAWLQKYPFRKLDPTDVYDTSVSARLGAPMRPEITPEIVAGADGSYWLAERNRWREGVELTPEDFELLLRAAHTGDQQS